MARHRALFAGVLTADERRACGLALDACFHDLVDARPRAWLLGEASAPHAMIRRLVASHKDGRGN